MDGDGSASERQGGPWPRLRHSQLYSRSGEVTDRRVRDYLQAMGLPPGAGDAWREAVQSGSGDARQAFFRLHRLISERWREQAGGIAPHPADPGLAARLCAWLEPGHDPCPPWLVHLFDVPPVQRCSMAPQDWHG